MNRSFADHMGWRWPKDLACIVNGERITWAQLKAAKIERQKERLRRILEVPHAVRQAAYIWVFYQPGLFGFAYQGYWLAIRTLNHTWTFNFRDHMNGLQPIDIMKMIPCGVLPLEENFEKWKEAFVKKYCRPGRFKRQGMIPGWVECEADGLWPDKFTVLS